MNQGPIIGRLLKKPRGQQSHSTVPLKEPFESPVRLQNSSLTFSNSSTRSFTSASGQQCCGAETIRFGSSSGFQQVSAPAPTRALRASVYTAFK